MIPIIQKEPAVVSGAIIAVLNACVLLGWVQLDEFQLAGINTALVAVLTLFTRQSVTPNVTLDDSGDDGAAG